MPCATAFCKWLGTTGTSPSPHTTLVEALLPWSLVVGPRVTPHQLSSVKIYSTYNRCSMVLAKLLCMQLQRNIMRSCALPCKSSIWLENWHLFALHWLLFSLPFLVT